MSQEIPSRPSTGKCPAIPAAWALGKTSQSILSVGLCALMSLPAWAADGDTFSGLADLSIEQLMNESVTSVSKKETKLNESPAAISVITGNDISHLGITSIPEALRLVPGMDIARIDGNEWAVSSRGFNNEFANKLLVLVDGRTVYTPASAGVFWNAQDVVMEDLDRIEVIRGPGATLWGANAVNGVVNVITKSAKETQGMLTSTSVGSEDQPSTTVRYGGKLGSDLYYRIYTKYFDRDGLVDSTGKDASDDWETLRQGFRVDWEPSPQDSLTLQGDYYQGDAEHSIERLTPRTTTAQVIDSIEHNSGANVLARWTRSFSESSSLKIQAYSDQVKQGDGFGTEYRNTYDFDMQHRFALGGRNDIVWGAGYRWTAERNPSSFNLAWNPERQRVELLNFFLQDDILLVRDRLHLTLGSKFEHNNLTGWAIQPSTRLLWTPTARQTLWAAVSRADRTPSLFERDSRVNAAASPQTQSSPALLVSNFGNPDTDSEKLTSYEIGYRIEPTKRFSLDLSGFYNIYEDLLTYSTDATRFETSPNPPHLLISSTIQNAQSGRTYGAEMSAQWQATDRWRLVGSYTWLQMELKPDPGSSAESESPQHQFQIRSYLQLPRNFELNGAVYYVDRIHPPSGPSRVSVPSYLRCDLGIVWHPTESLEVGVWGQNLLDSRHSEFASVQSPAITLIPRSIMGKVTWRF